jgi:hypothetical protein
MIGLPTMSEESALNDAADAAFNRKVSLLILATEGGHPPTEERLSEFIATLPSDRRINADDLTNEQMACLPLHLAIALDPYD